MRITFTKIAEVIGAYVLPELNFDPNFQGYLHLNCFNRNLQIVIKGQFDPFESNFTYKLKVILRLIYLFL